MCGLLLFICSCVQYNDTINYFLSLFIQAGNRSPCCVSLEEQNSINIIMFHSTDVSDTLTFFSCRQQGDPNRHQLLCLCLI